MAHRAASDCYRKSGYSPRNVDVIELHDCFACSEVSILSVKSDEIFGKIICNYVIHAFFYKNSFFVEGEVFL